MGEAEKLHREALDIRRKLVKGNSVAYETDVAQTCNNLAGLYYSTGRKDDAEKMSREALDIYRRLAKANPAAYEPNVAMTCYNYGLLLRDTHRNVEAKPLFEEAARLWGKYPHKSDLAQRARDELNKLSAPNNKPFDLFRRKGKK